MPTRPSQTKHTEQNILNNSYDSDFDVSTVEMLAFDSGSNALVRVNANASGQLVVSGGGGNGTIIDGVSSSIVATVKDLTNSNPLATALVDANGDQITSFGGGTQYTEGDIDATITGNAFLWEDTSNTLTTVSATKPLPVSVPTHAVTQSGTWTVQPGNTANTTAWKVDGSAVTQPVSLASVPSHAVTNAGTFAVQSAQSGTYSVRPDSYATDDTAMPSTPLVLPVAGEYRSSATTYADGDATVLQTDVNGNLKVTSATLIAGEDLSNNVLKSEHQYTPSGVLTTSTQVKGSAGFVHTITISQNDAAPTAGTIDVYNNTAGSGTKIFTWTLTTVVFTPFTVTLDQVCTTGIYVAFTTTADVAVSVSYR